MVEATERVAVVAVRIVRRAGIGATNTEDKRVGRIRGAARPIVGAAAGMAQGAIVEDNPATYKEQRSSSKPSIKQRWLCYNRKMRKGRIIPNGVVLEKHEYKTVLFFTELGQDIELIPKSNKEGVHSPDIRMDGALWEMKAPKGEGKYLIANTVQRAVKQSHNIIIDLRRTKRHQTKCLSEIKKEFERSRSLRWLKIITKTQKIVELKK